MAVLLGKYTRVNATWLWWKEITGILCDRHMAVHLKLKAYRMMIHPVELCGAECCPTTKSAELLSTCHVDAYVPLLIRSFPVWPHSTCIRLQQMGKCGKNTPLLALPTTVNTDGKCLLRRPKQRWQDTLDMDMTITNWAQFLCLITWNGIQLCWKLDAACAGKC